MWDEAFVKRRERLPPTLWSQTQEGLGKMINLDVPRERCEKYNTALSELSLRRYVRKSTAGKRTCDRKAIKDQCLGARQNLDDCTAFLIIASCPKSCTNSLGLASWQMLPKLKGKLSQMPLLGHAISNTSRQKSRPLHGSPNCRLKLLPTFERL
jgi:hypothetical protein